MPRATNEDFALKLNIIINDLTAPTIVSTNIGAHLILRILDKNLSHLWKSHTDSIYLSEHFKECKSIFSQIATLTDTRIDKIINPEMYE